MKISRKFALSAAAVLMTAGVVAAPAIAEDAAETTAVSAENHTPTTKEVKDNAPTTKEVKDDAPYRQLLPGRTFDPSAFGSSNSAEQEAQKIENSSKRLDLFAKFVNIVASTVERFL